MKVITLFCDYIVIKEAYQYQLKVINISRKSQQIIYCLVYLHGHIYYNIQVHIPGNHKHICIVFLRIETSSEQRPVSNLGLINLIQI